MDVRGGAGCGRCPSPERGRDGAWFLPVTIDPGGRGPVGAVRARVALDVPGCASKSEARAGAERLWPMLRDSYRG